MDISKANLILNKKYPGFSGLIACFTSLGLEIDPNYSTDEILNAYIKLSQPNDIQILINSIDRVLQKYHNKQDSLNLFGEALTWNSFYYREFESGAVLFNYIQKYLMEKLQTL